jgi:hypothetical protein
VFATPVTGQRTGMTSQPDDVPINISPEEDPTDPLPDEAVNLTPGPTDRGGEGGMASREQAARKARQSD